MLAFLLALNVLLLEDCKRGRWKKNNSFQMTFLMSATDNCNHPIQSLKDLAFQSFFKMNL